MQADQLSDLTAEPQPKARALEAALPSARASGFFGIEEIGFYGLRSADEVAELRKALDTLRRLYDNSCFVADMMCSFGKSFSFGKDAAFVEAVQRHDVSGHDKIYIWRLHTLVWAARSALNLPGDFVECGVYMGYSARVIVDILDFQARDKSFYLYDTFEGLSEEYSSETERAISPHAVFSHPDLHGAVESRFQHFDNVHVIKGVVPDILAESSPEKIAFLHLDMNAAQAEIGALDALFERVVPGGPIVFDDFGRSHLPSLCVEETAWMKARGYEILELPTGQGLVIKR